MVELIQLLIDKPEVQALSSHGYDEIPSIDDRAAANIDKAELKVQELLSSFCHTTFTNIEKTYDVGRRFCSLPKVVW